MATSNARIAIAYDGSASATTAVRTAAGLFGTAQASRLGSVSSGPLHNAELPILVVPGPSAAPGD